MVFIECCDKFFVFSTKSRIIVFENKPTDEQVNRFDLKIPEFEFKNNKSLINNTSIGDKENPLCGKFSTDCSLFVISDVYKRLIIWRTSDGHSNSNDDRSWLIIHQFNCDKKAVQLSFLKDNSLLVGDKGCDVYRYDLESGECKLLFGHMSILLQMKICPEEKFIITCDRDEKVRVTNYPSVYNIQSFLLGHREFVSCCTFVDRDRLVTGSGDSTIRLWQIIDGEELFGFDLSSEERLNKLKNGEKSIDISSAVSIQSGSQSIANDSTKQSANRLAIKNVFYYIASNRLVITFFNLANLVTFVVSERLVLDQILAIPSIVLDAISHHNRLYLQTVNDGLISFEFKECQLTQVSNHFLTSISDNRELLNFNEKELVDGHLRSLYKSTHTESEDREYGEEKRRKK